MNCLNRLTRVFDLSGNETHCTRQSDLIVKIIAILAYIFWVYTLLT